MERNNGCMKINETPTELKNKVYPSKAFKSFFKDENKISDSEYDNWRLQF